MNDLQALEDYLIEVISRAEESLNSVKIIKFSATNLFSVNLPTSFDIFAKDYPFSDFDAYDYYFMRSLHDKYKHTLGLDESVNRIAENIDEISYLLSYLAKAANLNIVKQIKEITDGKQDCRKPTLRSKHHRKAGQLSKRHIDSSVLFALN